MGRDELDDLFRRCPPGPIPAGQARGTAIVLPGSWFDRFLCALIRALIWKGKVFSPKSGDLRNLIGPFAFRIIRAKVYQDQSWFATGPAIILDYSRTSFVAGMIRDEIRQVAPGLYLGQVYWGKRRIALFMLEFPTSATTTGGALHTIAMALAGAATWIGAVSLVAALLGGIYLVARLRDDRPVTYADAREHFKYGSTGGERGYAYQLGFGIPYWIWVAMPELFPQYLPDSQSGKGYTSFGLIYEDGKDPRFDLPIGMSMRRVQGIDRVYFNCAVCHTGSVRDAPGAPRQIVLGMPANTLNLGALIRFLNESAGDWRFRSTRMLPKIEDLEAQRRARPPNGQGYHPRPFSPIDSFVFRYLGIMLMREQLLTFTSRLSFIHFETWGPGRVDTFNPPKALLGFPMQNAPASELVGNADFPAVWNQRWKEGLQLHWDGNNTRVDERNLSAAFGTGATPATLDKQKLLRMAAYLWDQARPPDFPARSIRSDLAARGAPIYRTQCWSCHGNGRPPFHTTGDGSLVGTVTPIEQIATDRARLDSYTPVLAEAQNSLYAGYPADADQDWCRDHPDDTGRCYPARFSHFRKTNGYANVPLDGLWLRAPYLHNGSVPDLRALLEPAKARPPIFFIGYDVYDYDRVGFVTAGADAERHGWRYDTHLVGNGNGGHEYGTNLSADDKAALIEYLKTF
jgi:mono/diheme cytochrome c family protein